VVGDGSYHQKVKFVGLMMPISPRPQAAKVFAFQEIDALHATPLRLLVCNWVMISPVPFFVGSSSAASVLLGQCVEVVLVNVASEKTVESLKDIEHGDVLAIGRVNRAGPRMLRRESDEDVNGWKRWFGRGLMKGRGGGDIVVAASAM
jgi:hypothetical protein